MLLAHAAALLSMAVAPSEVAAMVDAYEENRLAAALPAAMSLAGDPTASPETQATARLVILFTRLRQGRAQDSLEALAAIHRSGPELGTYGTYLESGILGSLRRCAESRDAAARLPSSSTFAPLAWSKVTSCFMRERAPDEARAALERFAASATADWQQAEALMLEARLAEREGALAEARQIYRQVLIDFPMTLSGAAARARLGELSGLGVRVAPISTEELLPRAEAERSRFRPGKARHTYRQIVAQAKRNERELKHQAQLGLVELDIVDKRYWQALGTLDKLLAESDKPSVRAQALYLRGDILSRRGLGKDAIITFQRAVSEHPDEAYSREAALSGARLAYSLRDFAVARALCDWLVASKVEELQEERTADSIITEDGAFGPGHGGAELRDYAYWIAAWVERRSGAPLDAVDSLLAKIDRAGVIGPAATYWRMRLAIEASDEEAAQTFAALLADASPTNFYAFAARDLLCGENKPCAVRLALPPTPSAAPPPRPTTVAVELQGALSLFEHGLRSEARRVLRVIPARQLTNDDKTVAGWIYNQTGEVHLAALLTRRAVLRSRDQLQDPALFEVSFPRPYRDVVDATARLYEVPPELVYAIMREESAFDPLARSPRDARGLMQMILPTARRIAEQAAVRDFRFKKLFDPKTSIRFGTHYLANLLEEFDGDLAAVVASYHAGEKNVHRWRARIGATSSDEFIEEIPYASTRKYVQKVLASFGLYRLFYRDELGASLGLKFATAR